MKNNKNAIIVKITLSILFLLCLLKMPYGYYQAARFAGMLGFGLLAYHNYQKEPNYKFRGNYLSRFGFIIPAVYKSCSG